MDRYFLDQNNKHETIRKMDQIYGAADLTIVALSGEGPRAGLPGVQGTPRSRQCQLNVDGNVFVDTGESFHGPLRHWRPCEDIRRSWWYTRGWTYQEMLLSPRRLVFTSSCMYFQCREAYFTEAMSGFEEVGRILQVRSTQAFPETSFEENLAGIWNRLSKFCLRRLSYEEDSIDAFVGVLRALNSSDEAGKLHKLNDFYGVPINRGQDISTKPFIEFFLQNLLWWCICGVSEERDVEFARNSFFPSWS